MDECEHGLGWCATCLDLHEPYEPPERRYEQEPIRPEYGQGVVVGPKRPARTFEPFHDGPTRKWEPERTGPIYGYVRNTPYPKRKVRTNLECAPKVEGNEAAAKRIQAGLEEALAKLNAM